MSFVTVQVGQCGNQIGQALLNKLNEEMRNGEDEDIKFITDDLYFNLSEDGQCTARAVLVDTEPKVIERCISQQKKSAWSYDESCQVFQQGGAGNNWAHGYKGYGPLLIDDILEAVRVQAEYCDWLAGFNVLASVAGGTGSGLGAYVIEALADQYPSVLICNVAICPYATGEVILQNYNACLTLSHSARASSAVLLMENSNLSRLAARVLGLRSNKSPSFQDINAVIGRQLASVFLPCYKETSPSSSKEIWQEKDSLYHLCPHPGFNMLSATAVPQGADEAIEFSTDNWEGLNRRLLQMHLCGKSLEEDINWSASPNTAGFNKAVANVSFSYGPTSLSGPLMQASHSHHYASWNRAPYQACWSPNSFHRHDKYVSMLSNSQACLPFFDQLVSKAYEMYQSKAYMHQYLVYGLEEQDFMDGFVQLDQVRVNYQSLSNKILP